MCDYKKIKCVILDLDKTIIGDLTDISSYDTLINAFNWKNNLYDSFKKIDDTFIMNILQNGLLRPDIINFIHHLYIKCGINIVIYTLSEREWASRILNQITKIIGYKFFCLLLCREDCINNNKSIIHVIRKLNDININVELQNILMYDDNRTVKTNLVLVPKYNYKPLFNMIRELNPKLVKVSLEDHDYKQFIFTLKIWKYDIEPFIKQIDIDYEVISNNDFLSNDNFFLNEIKKF